MKKLGFGLMRLPLLDKNDYSSVDVERVKKMVDQFMENGFTYFDTAAPYHQGNSEVTFREAVVKRYPRMAYTITDKLSLFMIRDRSDFPAFFDSQLERLGVDYVDYYWLHGLGGPSYRQAEEWGAFQFVQILNKLERAPFLPAGGGMGRVPVCSESESGGESQAHRAVLPRQGGTAG